MNHQECEPGDILCASVALGMNTTKIEMAPEGIDLLQASLKGVPKQSLSAIEGRHEATAKAKTQLKHNSGIVDADLREFRLLLERRFDSVANAWESGLDIDHNGQLTRQEFSQACDNIGFVGSYVNIDNMWAELDGNGVGYITLADLAGVVAPGLGQDVNEADWPKDILFTMHGCKCAEHWQFDGYTHQGCAVVSDHTGDTISQPLCFVKDATACKRGYSMAKLANVTGSTGICQNASCAAPSESTWDFCHRVQDVSPYMTQSSCHCSPQWEFQSNLYSGCSQTGESEPSWCYVAADCAQATEAKGNRTQKWDFCNLPQEKPAYLTRHGCHCKPKWESGGTEYTTC